MITVIDVARSMGVELDKSAAWSVGAAVRSLYETEYGRSPAKELRTKTNGGGSHCFAVYPQSYRSTIERAIRATGAAKAKQGNLL